MKILFIGDIVGKGGRHAVMKLVPVLRRELGCGFVIANGENMAGGGGLNKKCLDEMKGCGVDVITSGDHVWDQKEFEGQIMQYPQVLRPANLHPAQPGRGFGVFTGEDGVAVGVLCLLGRTFMPAGPDCPFRTAESAVAQMQGQTRLIVVDMHAEATSEKIAVGRYLDGRVTAVLGTHTHVPTADEQIFPGGTAFQADVGMVGARESILGRSIPAVLKKFSTGMPSHFVVMEEGIRLQATLIEATPASGKATAISRLVRDYEG